VVTARSISPGKSGTLEITFDPHRRSGEQENSVRLQTNDPENENVVVTIRAYVRAPLMVEPTVAHLGTLGRHEEKTIRMAIRIHDPQTVSVKGINISSPWIGARMVEGPTAGKPTLEVKIAPGMPLGKIQETVQLHTTSESQPLVEIPVSGRVLGDIRLQPEAISFQGPEAGRHATPLEVTVTTVGRKLFKIKELDDTTGHLVTSLEELDPGRAYRIAISLKSGDAAPVPRNFNGVLRILTDHPDQPVLELPVHRSGRRTVRPGAGAAQSKSDLTKRG